MSLVGAKRSHYLAAVLIVLAGVPVYQNVVLPRQRAIHVVSEQVTALEESNQRRRETEPAVSETEKAVDRELLVASALVELIPSADQAGRAYGALTAAAAGQGVDLLRLTPSDPVLDSAVGLLRQHWSVEAEGSYHGLARFLGQTATLPGMARPGVESVRPVGAPAEGPRILSAVLSVETYSVHSSATPGAAAPAAAVTNPGASPAGRRAPLPAPLDRLLAANRFARDPFEPPVVHTREAHGGPSLVLTGILHSNRRASVAVFADPVTGRRHALGEGERAGALLVTGIYPTGVAVIVTAGVGAGEVVARRETWTIRPADQKEPGGSPRQ